MSDPDPPQPEVPEVVKVARDLREIERLVADEGEVVARANAVIDGTALAGGLAMVELAGAAKPDELAELIAFAELHHLAACAKADHKKCRIAGAEHVEDQDADWGPALQTLLFWSEALRNGRGEDYGRRPTVASEANYLRYQLDAMWRDEPHWDDFAADIRQARTRLENVLHAGRRAERTRVTCDRCDADEQLVKVYGRDEAGDRWKCTMCKAWFDAQGFAAAHAKQLRSEGAQRFIPLADAIGTLKAQGRSERTIRKWLQPVEHVADQCAVCGAQWPPSEYAACPADAEGDECGGLLEPVRTGDPERVVEGYCDVATRRVFAWWPSLWTLHLTTQNRKMSA